jgi:hypothetical protein
MIETTEKPKRVGKLMAIAEPISKLADLLYVQMVGLNDEMEAVNACIQWARTKRSPVDTLLRMSSSSEGHIGART